MLNQEVLITEGRYKGRTLTFTGREDRMYVNLSGERYTLMIYKVFGAWAAKLGYIKFGAHQGVRTGSVCSTAEKAFQQGARYAWPE